MRVFSPSAFAPPSDTKIPRLSGSIGGLGGTMSGMLNQPAASAFRSSSGRCGGNGLFQPHTSSVIAVYGPPGASATSIRYFTAVGKLNTPISQEEPPIGWLPR